jgi:hypothetical protein
MRQIPNCKWVFEQARRAEQQKFSVGRCTSFAVAWVERDLLEAGAE